MRIVPALSAFVAIAALSCAAAQSDVTVYPQQGQVLYDPGTGQERVVPPLRQPWQFHRKPIKLHPPSKHHRRPSSEARAAKPPTHVASTPPRPHKTKRAVAAAPAKQSAPLSGFANFDDLMSSQQAVQQQAPKKAAAVTPSPKKPALE